MPVTALDVRKQIEEELRELIEPNDPTRKWSPLKRKIAYYFLHNGGERMDGIEAKISDLAKAEAERRNQSQASLAASYRRWLAGGAVIP